jgi:NAD dependent epimerase/dehydratase family enzyme
MEFYDSVHYSPASVPNYFGEPGLHIVHPMADTIRAAMLKNERPPLPGFAARLVLGEMAEALLLASQRVEPRRLLESGYRFRRPEIDGALKALLG